MTNLKKIKNVGGKNHIFKNLIVSISIDNGCQQFYMLHHSRNMNLPLLILPTISREENIYCTKKKYWKSICKIPIILQLSKQHPYLGFASRTGSEIIRLKDSRGGLHV